MFKRIGYLAEAFQAAPDEWLERCRANITTGISELDPASPKEGRVVGRWNLRVNVAMGENGRCT
ncbi:hypothetical protein D3C83_187380 [compost metagenome]